MLFGLALLIFSLSACQKEPTYTRFSHTFEGAFDTGFQIIAYTKTEAEFLNLTQYVEERINQLHILFDKYNSYPNVNNLHYINLQAAKEEVIIEEELFDFLQFSLNAQNQYAQKTNIALGAVLELWSYYRDLGIKYPEEAATPPLPELQEALTHCNIEDLHLNPINSSVYFSDPLLKLDVGAVAKGYATELVTQELIKQGYTSFIISSGGNVRVVGQPKEANRSKWGVGLQDPNRYLFGNDRTLDTVFVTDTSVVSSGDYQRYYYVNDQLLHHLIDPQTLFPAQHYRAVNVIYQDSGLADFFSTEIFLLAYTESRALAEEVEGLEAQWVFADGTIEMTDGFAKLAQSQGATSK